jgi:hypothetical protein
MENELINTFNNLIDKNFNSEIELKKKLINSFSNNYNCDLQHNLFKLNQFKKYLSMINLNEILFILDIKIDHY